MPDTQALAAADADHLPPPAHEAQDVTVRFLAVGGAGLVGVVALLAGLATLLYPRTATVGVSPAQLIPTATPALQSSPRAEMQALRAAQRAWLDGAGSVDRERGVTHIPIARAMRDVAAHGLPGWPR